MRTKDSLLSNPGMEENTKGNQVALWVIRNKTDMLLPITVEPPVDDNSVLVKLGTSQFAAHPADALRPFEPSPGNDNGLISLAPRKTYLRVGSFPVAKSVLERCCGAYLKPTQFMDGQPGFGYSMYNANESHPSTNLLRQPGLPFLPFYSFTMGHNGHWYNIVLDVGKHVTYITAELNLQLQRIHPELVGYISCEKEAYDYEDGARYVRFELHLSVGEQTVTFISPNAFAQLETPLLVRTGQANAVNYTTDDAGTVDERDPWTHFGFFPDDNVGRDYVVSNLEEMNDSQSFTLDKNGHSPFNDPTALGDMYQEWMDSLDAPMGLLNSMFDDAVEINLSHAGPVSYTIPKSAFRIHPLDNRIVCAVLKLNRSYQYGRAYRINAYYKNDDGSLIKDHRLEQQYGTFSGGTAPVTRNHTASLDVVPAVSENYGRGLGIPINKNETVMLNAGDGKAAVGGMYDDTFFETGGYNDAEIPDHNGEYRSDYIMIFPAPIDSIGRLCPYFRPAADTTIEFDCMTLESDLEFVMVGEQDPAATVSVDDRLPILINPWMRDHGYYESQIQARILHKFITYDFQNYSELFLDVIPLQQGEGNFPTANSDFALREAIVYDNSILNFFNQAWTLDFTPSDLMRLLDRAGLADIPEGELPIYAVGMFKEDTTHVANLEQINMLPLRYKYTEPVLSQVWMEVWLGALVNGAPQFPPDHTLSVQIGGNSVSFDLPSTNGWLGWHVHDLGFTDIVEYTGTDDRPKFGRYNNDGSTDGPLVPIAPLDTVNGIEIYAVPAIDRDGNVWLRLLFRNTLSEQVNVRWSTSLTPADTIDLVYRRQSNWTRARVTNSGECDIQLAAAPNDFGTGLLLKQGEGYGDNVDWSLLDTIQPSGAYALRYILNGVDQQVMVQMGGATGRSIIIALWNSIETSMSFDSDDAGSFQLSINLSGGEDEIPFVNFAPVQSLNRLGVNPSLYGQDHWRENNIAVDLHFLPRLDADYQGIPSSEITDVFPWLFGEMGQSPVIHAPVCLLREPL